MPELDEEPTYRSVLVVLVGRRRETTCSRSAPNGRPNRRSCGQRLGRKPGGEEPVTVQDLADLRCSQAVLGFLSAADVGRLVPAGEDARSEASEWEILKRRGREEERRVEAEELGREGEEQPLFLPTTSFMAPAEEE